eukprot:351645-Chlamydomonas_euryale.AAC.1
MRPGSVANSRPHVRPSARCWPKSPCCCGHGCCYCHAKRAATQAVLASCRLWLGRLAALCTKSAATLPSHAYAAAPAPHHRASAVTFSFGAVAAVALAATLADCAC